MTDELCALCGGSLEEGDRGMCGDMILCWMGYLDVCDACAEEADD